MSYQAPHNPSELNGGQGSIGATHRNLYQAQNQLNEPQRDFGRQFILQSRIRSLGMAYVLWFFLGCLGVHRFYVGKVGTGIAMLGLNFLGWSLFIVGIGVIFLLIVWIWWLVDAVLLPKMVDQYNLALARTA